MNEISSDETPHASVDGVALVLARVRATRRPGAVNTTDRWQVRIRWGAIQQQWPPFTYDAKDSRADAVYCACQAEGWRSADADPYVIAAWVRGPGACAWESVSAARVSAA